MTPGSGALATASVPGRGPHGPRRLERGQATVEFALLLPLVVVVFALGIDLVLIGRDSVLVVHVAREGARIASLREPDKAVVAAVLRRGAPSNSEVGIVTINDGGVGDLVSVRVRWRVADRLLGFGRFARGLTVEHQVTMLKERAEFAADP